MIVVVVVVAVVVLVGDGCGGFGGGGDGFKAVWGFALSQTNERTDICTSENSQ